MFVCDSVLVLYTPMVHVFYEFKSLQQCYYIEQQHGNHYRMRVAAVNTSSRRNWTCVVCMGKVQWVGKLFGECNTRNVKRSACIIFQHGNKLSFNLFIKTKNSFFIILCQCTLIFLAHFESFAWCYTLVVTYRKTWY